MAKKEETAVLKPNWGLHLGTSPLVVPLQGVSDGYNFRIEQGTINNINLGWEQLGTFTLNGPVVYMDFFFANGVDERDIFITTTDIYSYNPANDEVTFVTPIYATGTASATGTAVTGTTTAWNTGTPTNAKAGDFIAFGSATEDDPAALWYEIATVNNNTSITLTGTGVPAPITPAGPYTIRKVLTSTVSNRWSTDVFTQAAPAGDDTWFGTNGIDPVVKWDGITQFAEYTALGFTAKTLHTYSNMMIYGAVTQGGTYFPNAFINSNVGEPENVSGGLSEQFNAFPNSNAISAMIPMGDNLVVYSRRNVTLVQFVGGDVIFVFRQTISELGPIAGGLVADMGDFHEFISTDGQYYFDGVSIKQFGEQVWRALLPMIDPTRIQNSFIHFNEEHGDLMWLIALGIDTDVGDSETGPETAYVEHYLEDTGDDDKTAYSRRYAPFLSASYTEQRGAVTWDSLPIPWASYVFRWNDSFLNLAFPISIFGDIGGKVWKINVSQTADGDPLPSYVRFKRRTLGDGRMRGLLKRIYPFLRPYNNDITVRTYYTDHASGDPTTVDDQLFDQNLLRTGMGEQWTKPYRRGRYFETEFRSDAGLPYMLDGYDIDVDSGGRR